MVEMTNFSLNEFRAIWSVLSDKVEMDWNNGRGRKRQHKPQDVLFMLLCTLKHAGNWDFNGKMFDIKGPTFERMILGFAERIYDTLYSLAVEKYEKKYTMGRLVKDGTTFRHYKFALYATDVTFQHTNRPAGNQKESKVYFSNKHKLYRTKSEVSVLPNGLAIGVYAAQARFGIGYRNFQEQFGVASGSVVQDGVRGE